MSTNQTNTTIRPMSFGSALLHFGIPAIGLLIAQHLIYPQLPQIGLTEFEALVLVTTIPMALLIAATAVSYQREGNEMNWSAFRARMRFGQLTWRNAALGIGIAILGMLGYGLLSALSLELIQRGLIWLPNTLPAIIDPRLQLTTEGLDAFVGGTIRGNWEIFILYFIMLFFNIVGEELWWRGYILPRQIAEHGRWAWLIHGILWTLFHAFKWWDLLNLLPICLLISYFSQRTRSSWPGFIAHYIFNGIGLLGILAAILGLL
ncbi:MAG: CPBP family intramembrane glutamic endopeptidase [Chloroflexota bacterium]